MAPNDLAAAMSILEALGMRMSAKAVYEARRGWPRRTSAPSAGRWLPEKWALAGQPEPSRRRSACPRRKSPATSRPKSRVRPGWRRRDVGPRGRWHGVCSLDGWCGSRLTGLSGRRWRVAAAHRDGVGQGPEWRPGRAEPSRRMPQRLGWAIRLAHPGRGILRTLQFGRGRHGGFRPPEGSRSRRVCYGIAGPAPGPMRPEIDASSRATVEVDRGGA